MTYVRQIRLTLESSGVGVHLRQGVVSHQHKPERSGVGMLRFPSNRSFFVHFRLVIYGNLVRFTQKLNIT